MKQAVMGVLGGLAVLAAGTFAVGSVSAKGHGQQEKAGVSTVAHKQSGKTDEAADSSSSDDSQTKTDADRFDELSQKEKIATLIKATYVDPVNGETDKSIGNPFLKTHYTIFMGPNNKLVIDDDGEGMGDTLEHSTMLQEKSDSYQSYSPDSSADDDADTNKSNAYWKAYKVYSKTDLWQNYSANKDTINQLVSLIDISKGSSDFSVLPMNQMSMPAGASSSSSDNKSDSDSDSDSNSNDSDSDNNSDDNSNSDDNNSSDNNSDSDDNDSDSNSDSNSSSSQSSSDSSSSSDSNDDF